MNAFLFPTFLRKVSKDPTRRVTGYVKSYRVFAAGTVSGKDTL